MIKRYTVVGLIMRLTGHVTLNGVRIGLDWTITGTTVNAGPGLPADDVKVHVSLPDYTNSSGDILLAEANLSETETGGLWDLTVTDLRLKLKEAGLPIYGNKGDLIERLEGSMTEEPAAEEPAAAPAEEPAADQATEEPVVEEVVSEVSEDAEGQQ